MSWLRTLVAILGIQFAWAVVGLAAVLAFAATECSTPKCKADEVATMQIIVWVVFFGFMATLAAYFYRRHRKAGRS